MKDYRGITRIKHKYKTNKIGHIVMGKFIYEYLKGTFGDKMNNRRRTVKQILFPTVVTKEEQEKYLTQ